MKNHKISKVLNDSAVSKFVTRKQIEVNDLSSGQYLAKKNIRFKTPMLRLDLCDYSDADIAVKGRIRRKNRRNKKLIFKNNSPFRSCMSKTNNTFIYNADVTSQFVITVTLCDTCRIL